MNAGIQDAATNGIGLGEGLGRFIADGDKKGIAFQHRPMSLLAEAYVLKVR